MALTSQELNQMLEEAKCLGCYGASMTDMAVFGILNRILTSLQTSPTAMQVPHAMLSNTDDLTVGATNVSYPVTFDTIEDIYNIGFTAGGSDITIQEAGSYLTLVSAICDSTNAVTGNLSLWQVINGIIVPRSNTIVTLQSQNTEVTLAVSFINEFAVGDVMTLRYHGSNIAFLFNATAATAGPPARPISPSIIVTIHKVSA